MFRVNLFFNKQSKCKLFLQVFILLSFCFILSSQALKILADEVNQENQASTNNQNLLDAGQLLIEGTNCLHNNQNSLAKKKLANACAIAPDLSQAHHQLGIALAKLGENEEAANEFIAATKLNPSMAASWLNLAAIYQSSGKIKEAKTTYEEFLVRFPKDIDVPKIRNLTTLLDKAIFEQAANTTNNANNYTYIDNNIAGDYYAEITKRGVWLWLKGNMPLMVYIEPANVQNGALPRFIVILKEAFQDWIIASKGMIDVNFINDIHKANIICTWSKEIAKFKNSNEAANTKIYADKKGLYKGEIEFLTRSASDGSSIGDNQMRSTCLHEIGHILGIAGHSSNSEDVMYISAPLKNTRMTLSERDKNTLSRLYSNNL